ncbi:MAG: sulfatase [Acidobacteria bacterium]|nr:sulfatase [Acidobacteriota bacterium]
MRALSLFGVFVLAKIIIVAGHSVPRTGWTPIAYFWEDLLAALIFATLDFAVRRPWFGWALYGAAVAYVAVNVPLGRVLSTPLTWPMLRATRGALSDSIRHHVTTENIALMFLIVIAGITLPVLLQRVFSRVGADLSVFPGLGATAISEQKYRSASALKNWKICAAVLIPALTLILLGPLATSRIDTIGLHRNAVVALATTALPRIASRHASDDWQASPFENSTSDDLSRFRGAAAGRNVVMILLESTAAQYLRPYGAAADPMPNLTELASRAILFENTYAVYPESIKALFSVLCARYPAIDTETESYAKITTPSIASALAAAGYRTALFHSGRFMYLGMESIVANRGFRVLEDAGAISGHHESSFGVDEPSTVRRILSWIDSLPRGEHFFLTYMPIAGHHPYDTPEAGPFPEREDFDRYQNALHYADRSLGELTRGLKERGLAENTLFVIFGDHGEAFGQHEGNYGHSLFLYEENIHVPYLVIAPGLVREQVRVSRPTSLIDTTPTILDLVGLPRYQGRSMLEGSNRMALFYTDYSLSLLGLRDGCWKYIYELESRRSKLFDLCKDSREQNDIADRFPERVAVYRAHVLRWSAAQKAIIKAKRENGSTRMGGNNGTNGNNLSG